MNGTNQYCTFYVGKYMFGVDVQHVQEVLRGQVISAVPLANPTISGLINLRGQIITALDLRHRFHLDAIQKAHNELMNVVVVSENETISLLVDRVGDVIAINNALSEPPPMNLCKSMRTMIKKIYQHEKQLLLVIDVEKTIDLFNSYLQTETSEAGS